MLNPGTLFILRRDQGTWLRPRVFGGLEHDLTCLVISSAQVSFGTRGATNRYLVLGDERLLTLEVDGAQEVKLKILKEA